MLTKKKDVQLVVSFEDFDLIGDVTNDAANLSSGGCSFMIMEERDAFT